MNWSFASFSKPARIKVNLTTIRATSSFSLADQVRIPFQVGKGHLYRGDAGQDPRDFEVKVTPVGAPKATPISLQSNSQRFEPTTLCFCPGEKGCLSGALTLSGRSRPSRPTPCRLAPLGRVGFLNAI